MSTYRHALDLAGKTPTSRNRYVDFLRAASIIVVVLGHWLMAAPHVVPGGLEYNVLLSEASWTRYLTWILQVMPIFFLVGGYANAVSWRSAMRRDESYGIWLRARLRRLLLPVLPLLAVWTVGAYILLQTGYDRSLLQFGSQGALVPVWFLATYVAVVSLTPITLRLWDRFGWNALLVTGAVAGLMDFLSLGGAGPTFAGYLNYLFMWGTVHSLGYAWADSRIGDVTQRLVASAAGLAATAALVFWGPYPVAMVGLNTQGVNNSQPPKVTLLTLAVFQAGLILALEGPARRWLTRERAWAGVVMVNGRIMTLYLWHMTAMVAIIGGSLMLDGVGLGVAIDTREWWLTRPLWIAALAATTIPFLMTFGRFERPKRDHRPAPPTWQPVAAVIAACVGLGLLAALGVSDEQGLNGLALALPFAAAVAGGIGGARRWERRSQEKGELHATMQG
ncbi:MAG TPA: acyltransferase [Acidimicrobiia bacterium]|nr:acyltransferase [Acidimicrobiia bacterium]